MQQLTDRLDKQKATGELLYISAVCTIYKKSVSMTTARLVIKYYKHL